MTVKITKDYAPVVSSGARSGIKMDKCIGVTIHNTDNDGAGANAKAHANLLKNTWKKKQQSWHFAVDEDGAYQSIPTDEVAWHAGDGGTGKGNTQTVAIEICMNSDGDLEKATDNAAKLAAQVLKEKGLSADKLYQHHDWSGKNCPSQIRAGKPYSWDEFKSKVALYYNGSNSSSKPTSTNPVDQVLDVGSKCKFAADYTVEKIDIPNQWVYNSRIGGWIGSAICREIKGGKKVDQCLTIGDHFTIDGTFTVSKIDIPNQRVYLKELGFWVLSESLTEVA